MLQTSWTKFVQNSFSFHVTSPVNLSHRVPILVNSTTTSLNQKNQTIVLRPFYFFISIDNQPPNLWIPPFSHCSNLIPPLLSILTVLVQAIVQPSEHSSTSPLKSFPSPLTDKLLIKHQYDHIFFLGKRVQSLPTAFRVSSKFLSRLYKGLHIWCHHCPLPPLLWALLEFQSWSFSVQSPFLALDSLAGNSFFRFTTWLNKSCKTYPPTSSPKPGNLAQVAFLSEPCAHTVHNTVSYPRFTCLLPPPLQENYCILGHQGQVPHFICASHTLRAQ